jgi:hypothetical protein
MNIQNGEITNKKNDASPAISEKTIIWLRVLIAPCSLNLPRLTQH